MPCWSTPSSCWRPLTALLDILCALWPAARRRLVWLVLALAVVTTVLTPLTINAGEWLYDQSPSHAPILEEHAERGGWMIYFAIALLVVAMALAVQHWLESRSDEPKRTLATVVVAVARPRRRGLVDRHGGAHRGLRGARGVGWRSLRSVSRFRRAC